MKERVCDKLRQIANARECAFRSVGRTSLAKMAAIGKIRNVAGYISTQPEGKQLRAVLTVEQELLLIAPHEQSRFNRLREKIYTIIKQAHEAYNQAIY